MLPFKATNEHEVEEAWKLMAAAREISLNAAAATVLSDLDG